MKRTAPARRILARAAAATMGGAVAAAVAAAVGAALAVVLAAAVLAAPLAASDDVILRDGTKLSGTVIGVERGVYRLETDFGVALIKKERIARIEFGGAQPALGETAAPKPAPPPPPPTVRERRPPNGRIEERVEGNTYINDSFRFEMFKPPTWQVLEQAARGIPSAVAALGTPDETTLLVVGSVIYEAPPAAYAKILDASLARIYSDFVALPAEQVRVAGQPAIRRSFQGMAAGHEWHGLIVNLADGPVHYGIIGITRDELFQFKEGVLSKIMNSFRFR